jgi:hypothetical protein
LKVEDQAIPFVLCGDLNNLQSSQGSKRLIVTYRDRDNNKAGGSVEVGGGVGWGGKDGVEYDIYVRGEAHDDQGNYVEGKAEHNLSTEEGSSEVRGGHKE